MQECTLVYRKVRAAGTLLSLASLALEGGGKFGPRVGLWLANEAALPSETLHTPLQFQDFFDDAHFASAMYCLTSARRASILLSLTPSLRFFPREGVNLRRQGVGIQQAVITTTMRVPNSARIDGIQSWTF